MIDAMKQALAKFEHLWEIGIDAEYKVELLPEIEALRQAIEQAEYDKLTVKFGERAKEYLEGAKQSWDTSDMAHRSGGLSVEQEPVGEIIESSFFDKTNSLTYFYKAQPPVGTKLYTAPPKREFVGLTDKEIFHADNAGQGLIEFARAIEAKLKEKNNG